MKMIDSIYMNDGLHSKSSTGTQKKLLTPVSQNKNNLFCLISGAYLQKSTNSFRIYSNL